MKSSTSSVMSQHSEMNSILFKQPDNLTKDMRDSFKNEMFSDLTLVVNGVDRIPVHKIMLYSRSEYFRSMFNSGLSESTQKEITIDESSSGLFEKLLRYIYTGEMEFEDKSNWDELADMMIMSDKYLMGDLKSVIEDYLSSILSIDNFNSLYSAAIDCSAKKLQEQCLALVDSNAQCILKMEGFLGLNAYAVGKIIDRGSFKPAHSTLFTGVEKWIEKNGRKDAETLLSKIRLTEMPINFLLTTVRQSGLFLDARILDAAAAISATLVDVVPKAQQKLLRVQLQLFDGENVQSAYYPNPQPNEPIPCVINAALTDLNIAYQHNTLYDISLGSMVFANATLDSCGIRDGETIPEFILMLAHGTPRKWYSVTLSFEQ